MSKAHPIIHFSGRDVAVDIPQVAFATCIAGWAAWYCWDAWHASAEVENLIMILPVSIIAIVLYFFVLSGSIKRVKKDEEAATAPNETVSRKTAIKIFGSMVLLGGFVIAGPYIGFDVASFLYMLLMMAFLGERRPVALVVISVLFSIVVIYCFSTLLATPLPVLIFRGQGS